MAELELAEAAAPAAGAGAGGGTGQLAALRALDLAQQACGVAQEVRHSGVGIVGEQNSDDSSSLGFDFAHKPLLLAWVPLCGFCAGIG